MGGLGFTGKVKSKKWAQAVPKFSRVRTEKAKEEGF